MLWRPRLSSSLFSVACSSVDGTRTLQHTHNTAVQVLSLQPASITSSGAFKPQCNDLSQFREDIGENLIS